MTRDQFIHHFPSSDHTACLPQNLLMSADLLSSLPGLLRFKLVQLSLLPFNLGLLRRHSPLHFRVLLLARLYLIADQRSANKPDGRADAGAGAGIPGGATDDRSQARPGKSSDRGAFFSSRKRLGTTEEK
jgi:hypothetical protein